jgi:hypothetical protein
MPSRRSAQEVIDQAIHENRAGEWLCYAFAIVFVVVGIGVLIWGAIAGQVVVSVAGSIASILFWPAMREARQIRKENIAIRLLEAPLSKADTATAAAQALRDAFTAVFVGKGNRS